VAVELMGVLKELARAELVEVVQKELVGALGP
jgi:hypothetical protein